MQFWKLLLSACDLSSHFVSKVLFLLLDAFALDVVDGIHEGDLAAQLLGSVGNVAGHVALKQVSADELLLQQADVLVEGSHLALSDLFLDLSGLGSHLGIVVHQSDLNSHLLVNLSLGNHSLVPVLSAHSSDLHSNVLTDLGSVDAAFHSQIDQNANTAAAVEAEGYGRLCRLEEIVLFAKKAGYHKLGLIFCMGLHNEARTVNRILRHHGFEVVSVICKNGSIPKSYVGLTDAQTLSGCADEVVCNPIGQALMMNEQKTEFNILLGLCVGHDTLAIKYLDAPVTVLAVKDRVTGHNPLAAVYLAEGYYKKRFFEEKED